MKNLSLPEIKKKLDGKVETNRGNVIWSIGSIRMLLSNTHHKGYTSEQRYLVLQLLIQVYGNLLIRNWIRKPQGKEGLEESYMIIVFVL